MANTTNGATYSIDTTGSITTDEVFVTSIVVVASADTWSAIINEGTNTNPIFRADSALANHRTYGIPINSIWEGIHVATLTNIALVTIYTRPVRAEDR